VYSRSTHTLAQTDRLITLAHTVEPHTVVHTVALLRPNLTRRTHCNQWVRAWPLQLTVSLTVEEYTVTGRPHCVWSDSCTLQPVCLSQ
jgi:hypothetical protein